MSVNCQIIYLGQERLVTYKDRYTMPYTDAVLLEVLRVSNVVHSAAPHVLDEDIEVEGKVVSDLTLFKLCILFRMHVSFNLIILPGCCYFKGRGQREVKWFFTMATLKRLFPRQAVEANMARCIFYFYR